MASKNELVGSLLPESSQYNLDEVIIYWRLTDRENFWEMPLKDMSEEMLAANLRSEHYLVHARIAELDEVAKLSRAQISMTGYAG